MRALSIRQPWAWLIVNGYKDIENRDWSTAFRGQVLIHAGKTMPRRYYEDVQVDVMNRFAIKVPAYEELARGGIVGVATITDCVSSSTSPWYQGAIGFVMADARSLPFHPCNGKLQFFDVQGVQL